MDKKCMGKMIANRRCELNLTQQELADKVEVNEDTIRNWEQGKVHIRATNLRKLESILGIALSDHHLQGGAVLDLPALKDINTLSELHSVTTSVLHTVFSNNIFSPITQKLVERSLYLCLGFEVVRNTDDIDWSDIREYVDSLVDKNDNFPIHDTFMSGYPWRDGLTLLGKKVHYMTFQIGGELFEAFDENGYYDDFYHQLERYAETVGHDLENALPDIESPLFTEYLVALQELRDHIQ